MNSREFLRFVLSISCNDFMGLPNILAVCINQSPADIPTGDR